MRVGREPVVRAGLKLLDQVGLEGLTLRAIAAELGVQAPTLYWRFKSKQDLVDEMASRVLADHMAAALDQPPPATWAEVAHRSGHGLRAELLRYRDGARMVAGTHLRDTSVYGGMEAGLTVFAADGIAPPQAALCLKTVRDFTIGFTIEEQSVLSRIGDGDPKQILETREAQVDAQRYPLARSVGAALFSDYDRAFDSGVRFIITGFAAGLPRGSRAWRAFRAFEAGAGDTEAGNPNRRGGTDPART